MNIPESFLVHVVLRLWGTGNDLQLQHLLAQNNNFGASDAMISILRY